MKITLEISDPTFRLAKSAASALGISLHEYVARAVAEKLSHAGVSNAKPWLECAGELAHLHEETSKIDKLIREEFERIEPEDRN